jgi:hypothetical protein
MNFHQKNHQYQQKTIIVRFLFSSLIVSFCGPRSSENDILRLYFVLLEENCRARVGSIHNIKGVVLCLVRGTIAKVRLNHATTRNLPTCCMLKRSTIFHFCFTFISQNFTNSILYKVVPFTNTKSSGLIVRSNKQYHVNEKKCLAKESLRVKEHLTRRNQTTKIAFTSDNKMDRSTYNKQLLSKLHNRLLLSITSTIPHTIPILYSVQLVEILLHLN